MGHSLKYSLLRVEMWCVCVCVVSQYVYLPPFHSGSDSKESACNMGDLGSIAGLGRSSGGGHGNSVQYSCLENTHWQSSLAGYSSWHCKKSDMTATQHTAAHTHTCILIFLLFFKFLLKYSCFTILYYFVLYRKMNLLYSYIYLLFLGFPSYFGHHRALSSILCATQYSLSYLFYTQYQ